VGASPRTPRLLAAIQPACFAVAAVLSMATEIVTTPESLIRPIVVALLIGLVAFATALALTRDWTLAAIFGSGFVLFTFRQTIPGMVLIGFGVWWLLIRYLRQARGRTAPKANIVAFVTRAVGIFSVVLLAVSAWGLVNDYRNGQPVWDVPVYDAAGAGGPDVYVILVDGYARADTLAETFAIDTTDFLAGLGELGMSVSPEAQSNYNKTWLSLASMFNGAYVDRIADLSAVAPDDSSIHTRWLQGMIQRASVLDAFRERGYVIRTVPSPFASTALVSADEVRQIGGLTEFEARLVSASPWTAIFRGPISELLASSQRDVVLRSLSMTAEFEEAENDQPQVIFTHVHSPHTPFVLHGADTEPTPLFDCFPTSCVLWAASLEELGIELDEYREGLSQQLAVLNDLLVSTIRAIVDADPAAIIILLSDHGSRYSLNDLDEHYRILFAARVPRDPDLFPADESPVNVFRRVLGHLGEDVSPLPYEKWWADWYDNLDLERIE
jgi:hypothetical protein